MKIQLIAGVRRQGARANYPRFTPTLNCVLIAGCILLPGLLWAQIAPKPGPSPATVEKGKNLRTTRENPTVNVKPVTVVAPATAEKVKPLPDYTLIIPAAVLNQEIVNALQLKPRPTVGNPAGKVQSRLPRPSPGNPDFDGDGRKDPAFGGDDCDDQDPERFPGNTEVCDPLGKDEDCNDKTCGNRDLDGDGYVDIKCFNRDSSGRITSQGTDPDDTNRAIYPGVMRYRSETEVEVCGSGIYRVGPDMRVVAQPNGTAIVVPR